MTKGIWLLINHPGCSISVCIEYINEARMQTTKKFLKTPPFYTKIIRYIDEMNFAGSDHRYFWRRLTSKNTLRPLWFFKTLYENSFISMIIQEFLKPLALTKDPLLNSLQRVIYLTIFLSNDELYQKYPYTVYRKVTI